MKRKILIVEDEAVLFLELKRLLKKNDYEIIGYESNGYTKSYDEAVKVIQKETPDMVLLDIKLKGVLNGIQLADKLNEFQIPFIYLSANSDEATLSEAQKTNPNTFLIKSKPIDDKQLLVTLQMAITRLSPIQITGVFVQKEYGTQGMKSDRNEKILLLFKDIHYITSADKRNNIAFGTSKNGKKQEYVLRKTLTYVESHLPKNFLRIHESFIVNLDKISARKNGKTICTPHSEFKIGTSYETKVKENLEAHFLK
jgi:DNA-binding LytR/AlgR family response regulator